MELASKTLGKPIPEEEVWFNFINSLKSPVTRETYNIHIKYYLKFCGFKMLSELLTIQEPGKQEYRRTKFGR